MLPLPPVYASLPLLGHGISLQRIVRLGNGHVCIEAVIDVYQLSLVQVVGAWVRLSFMCNMANMAPMPSCLTMVELQKSDFGPHVDGPHVDDKINSIVYCYD